MVRVCRSGRSQGPACVAGRNGSRLDRKPTTHRRSYRFTVARALWTLAVLFPVALPAAHLRARPILYDPVTLNIGLTCKWQVRCIDQQRRAMGRALKYVSRFHPPMWRIQQCNRNASRGRERVDWSGFNNCVRNASLQYRPSVRASRTKSASGRLSSRPHTAY